MADHELKTDPDVFQASWEGLKNFEIRLNDREFNPGDILKLRETRFSGQQMQEGLPLEYTGREIEQIVKYVLHGHLAGYGLDEGWVIMAVQVVNSYEL